MTLTAPAAPSYDRDLFTDDALIEPQVHYKALRALGPVVRLTAHEVYAVTRYAEARAVLADSDTFCSGQGVGLNEVINEMGAGRSLIMTDGELHSHLRKVLAGNLTPRALRHMQQRVDGLAAALVDHVVEKATFDAVSDLARALPLQVVPDLVGWPEDGRDHLLEWAGATFDLLGPMNDRARAAAPLTRDMQQFAANTAATGALLPGSVGAGVLEAAQRGDIDPARVPALIVGYLAPSLDTTISAIGSAVQLLADHPAQWAALRAQPSLVPNAFNEVLRLESPIRVFSRVTTTASTLGGVELPAGTRLAVFYGAANRDERHFAEPDEFNVARYNASEHLGFGYGVHGCAGQGLARMEAHALLMALVARAERLAPNGRPTRALNNLIHAWSAVPVRATSASR